jgi:DNA-binding NarL/FixJ family response regulator
MTRHHEKWERVSERTDGAGLMVEVLFVEDQPVMSEAAQAFVSRLPLVKSTFVCRTADSALTALRSEPDRWGRIFLDLEVPGAEGLSLAMEIKALGKAPITCVLTGKNIPPYISRIAASGFQGYILKTTATSEMYLAIKKAVAGESVFPSDQPSAISPLLTMRQTACLQLFVEGITATKAIAKNLGLSPSTVDGHMTAAMSALGVHSRGHAAVRALKLGLLKERPVLGKS